MRSVPSDELSPPQCRGPEGNSSTPTNRSLTSYLFSNAIVGLHPTTLPTLRQIRTSSIAGWFSGLSCAWDRECRGLQVRVSSELRGASRPCLFESKTKTKKESGVPIIYNRLLEYFQKEGGGWASRHSSRGFEKYPTHHLAIFGTHPSRSPSQPGRKYVIWVSAQPSDPSGWFCETSLAVHYCAPMRGTFAV